MPKISALPPMTTADAADEAPIVDTSVSTTKKWTLTLLKSYLQSLTSWITASMMAAGAQVQYVYNATSAVATGTTLVPLDDTIPQNTEGDQYLSQTITPTSATNLLEIEATIYISSTVANNMIGALFQDSTANAIKATEDLIALGSGAESTISIKHVMVAGTTSATTFKLRAGGNLAGTTTVNGRNGGRYFGATPKSIITIKEIKV